MSTWTQAFGTALVDSLWQGALVGVLLWVLLRVLRQSSAAARYTASCAALFMIALLPVLTIATLWAATSSAPPASASTAPPPIVPQTMLQIWFVPESPRIAWLDEVQRRALPVWSLGVLIFSIRLATACLQAFRLRRRAPPADPTTVAAVETLAARVGVARPVRVLVSGIADGPCVVGWLRPAILVPPAAMMGITAEQLEAVLAHELAHIKRHDYLANMLQVIAETLFFYHPAVWWVSRQIRIERELCCDDVAAASSGSAVAYARALVTLARQRLATSNLSMAATGGSLKYRVQRLLGAAPRDLEPAGTPAALLVAVAVAVTALNIDRLQALAQSQPVETVRFEVISIKRNTLNDRIVVSQSQNGRFLARGHTVAMLIEAAYRVQEFQVVGGPDWIATDRFDVQAIEPPGESVPQQPGATSPGPGQPSRRDLMLRALLEERFQLRVHKETRERPVFALVAARTDDRLGPQLTRSTTHCATAKGLEACGTSVGPGFIRARGVTMAQLATALSRLSITGSSLSRMVVDRSGLEGRFDAELKFTPENIPSAGLIPPSFPAIDPNGASIFTAIQEQLGLKLDARRGPVEVLVIDRVEPPAEN